MKHAEILPFWLFKYLCFLKGSVTEREKRQRNRMLSFTGSFSKRLNATIRAGSGQSQESGTACLVFHKGGRNPSTWAIHVLPPRCVKEDGLETLSSQDLSQALQHGRLAPQVLQFPPALKTQNRERRQHGTMKVRVHLKFMLTEDDIRQLAWSIKLCLCVDFAQIQLKWHNTLLSDGKGECRRPNVEQHASLQSWLPCAIRS